MSREPLSAIGYPLSETARADTVGAVIEHMAGLLASAGIASAAAEARDIVAFAMGQKRLWPATHADEPVSPAAAAWARAAAARRMAGAPFAYAVRRSDFRNLQLTVDERVLIPRQETEELVELVLRETGGAGRLIADIATGSGAIALSLAVEGAYDRIVATDVSADALAVARTNLAKIPARAAARVELRLGSLLAPIRGETLDAIVANPPYVALCEAGELPDSVREWEPPLALYGGPEGLDPYRVLVRDSAPALQPGGLVALEVDARRAGLVAEMLAVDTRYHQVSVHTDLSGRERFVCARRQRN